MLDFEYTDEYSEPLADISDIASQQSDFFLQIALMRHKHKSDKFRLKPKGYCHYCRGELDNHSALFCDSYCCSDFELEQRQRVINGGY